MDVGIVKESSDKSVHMDADMILAHIEDALKFNQPDRALGLMYQLVQQNTADLKRLKKEQVIQVLKDTSAVKKLATPTSSFALSLPSSELSIISKPGQGEVSILFVPSLGYARTLRNELARLVKEIDRAFGFDKKAKA